QPRVDAPGAAAQVRERRTEEDEERQRLDEPVREAERDPDEDDRGRPAEALEEREPEPAEGQLLDERREERDDDEVGREGARVRGLPARRRQALLLVRMQDGVEEERRDGDHDDDAEPDRRGTAPRRGAAEREGASLRQPTRHEEHEPEEDEELDQPADELVPAVERILRELAAREAAGVAESGEGADDRRPRHEPAGPGPLGHRSRAGRSASGAGAKCIPAAR